MAVCKLCEEPAEKELCVDCAGLVGHLQHKMRYKETAKLRVSDEGRSAQEAREVLSYAAEKLGLAVSFEQGETFVRANTSGTAVVSPPREPIQRVAGYNIDDIDPIRIELELETTRQRVKLFTQLVAHDTTGQFLKMLEEEQVKLAQTELLVEELARERAAKRAASKAS